ncbi:glycine--tRNA ligase [Candidatus Thorarchaeota archaeon]|nr:MAG: glycine--tRNA ligase [Candidatus Thorarchaeota archaeon]
MTSEDDFADTIYSLSKKRGFFWGPSPEIYGGSAGFYDLGPLGKLLKNRLESVIRSAFVKANFWEVECPTVSPRIVWEASGHIEGFIDPITECTKCGQTYRADNLIEEYMPEEKVAGLDLDELTEKLQELEIVCPSCKGELGPVQEYNLMLKTELGLDQEAYMRPETATSTYLLFKRLLTFFRHKLPGSVFQIGKAYRNEISPRQGMLRLREFTQVEGQIFLVESDAEEWPDFELVENEEIPLLPSEVQERDSDDVMWISMGQALKKGHFHTPAYAWCVHLAYLIFSGMGFPKNSIRLRQHLENERAHYAIDAWDVEIHTRSFGWVECCGVHDRGDYDLKRHQEYSGENLSVKVNKKPVVPSVLEIAFGVERPLYALLDNAYAEDEERVWLKFNPEVSPIQVAVFPLMSKDKLMEPALEIYEEINDSGLIVYFDKGGSIGRRYRRQDEIGTPFCVTIDYDTLDDTTVTIRERDSMEQIRVRRENLVMTLRDLVRGRVGFETLQ